MAAEREKAKKHKTFNEIEKRKVRRPSPTLAYPPTHQHSVILASAVAQRVGSRTLLNLSGFGVLNDIVCSGTVEDEKRVLRQMGGN
jgi:hypothetical protein